MSNSNSTKPDRPFAKLEKAWDHPTKVVEPRGDCDHCKNTGLLLDFIVMAKVDGQNFAPTLAIDFCDCRLGWEVARCTGVLFLGETISLMNPPLTNWADWTPGTPETRSGKAVPEKIDDRVAIPFYEDED